MIQSEGTPPTSKKVLYVITKANFGGAQRYVYDLATTAQEEGYVVEVVYGEDGLLREKLEEAGIPLFRIPALGRDVRAFSDVRAFIELWKKFRSTKPNVVHLNSSKVGALGALAARLAGVPKIIFTAHGWASTEDRPDIQKAVIGGIHWLTVLLAHRTIAVSLHTKQEMTHFPFVSKKMIVIHNAQKNISLLSQKDAREMLVAKAPGLGHYRTWIGTGTELHKNKGLDVAIRGFADIAGMFPGAALVIIGSGEERAPLEELATSLGVAEKVFLVGFVSAVSQALAAFDIFMLPSRKEGFPYIILEAGAAGVPLIASAVGGIPEAVKDMETGILIHPRNPSEISRALTSLLENPDKRERIGIAFKKDIAKRFPFSTMCKETFSLYQH